MDGRRTTTARRQALRSGWRTWVALAACYLLVVQAMVAGLSVTGHAAQAAGGPAAGGSFASVICTPEGARPVAGGGGSGVPAGQHHMGCCLIGCSVTGPTVAPPPAVVAALAAPSAVSVRLEIVRADSVAVGQRWSPRSARAPPATA